MQGVQFLSSLQQCGAGGAILADNKGLGTTAQAAVFLGEWL